jgi:hypothetical protein
MLEPRTGMTEPQSKPEQRALLVPQHVLDPTGTVAACWTEPKGVIVQLLGPVRGTTALAEWLVGPCFDQFLARFPGTERDLTVVLDMRSMLGRAANARQVMLQASVPARARVKRVVILPSIHLGPAYITIIEATAVVLRIAGYDVHVEDDLELALRKHDIRIEALSGVRRAVRP